MPFFQLKMCGVLYQGKTVLPDTHRCFTSAHLTGEAGFSCRCLQLTAALVKYSDKSTWFSACQHAWGLWSHLCYLFREWRVLNAKYCQGLLLGRLWHPGFPSPWARGRAGGARALQREGSRHFTMPVKIVICFIWLLFNNKVQYFPGGALNCPSGSLPCQ